MPKVTVITRKAYGGAYCVMGSKHIRTDVNLEKVGVVSDLPLDSSPIQLGTSGVYENRAFTVAGRILYDYDEGSWNEWHVMLNQGGSAWLSDAQSQYAVTFAVTADPLPALPAVGEVPARMVAQVIRQDRLGQPISARLLSGILAKGRMPVRAGSVSVQISLR